jgi:hypothetical protein
MKVSGLSFDQGGWFDVYDRTVMVAEDAPVYGKE